MSQDFKADQVKASKLIFSSSVLFIHSSSVSSDAYGNTDNSLFDKSEIGTDAIVYVSGVVGSHGTSRRGTFIIDGDLVVSGSAYNAVGDPIAGGGGGGIGVAGQSFFNHITLTTDTNTNVDTLQLVGAVSYNKSDYTLDSATHKTFFSAISYITAENITGTVQLYDLTNATQLCSFIITSSSPIGQRVEVSPAVGSNIIEARIKVDGSSAASDRIVCLAARLESVNTVD